MKNFEISYNFSDTFITANDGDISDSDEMSLRYSLFLGSLSFTTPKTSLNFDWEWIPLLDFAICINSIAKNLSRQLKGEEVFEFTESDGKIIFQRNRDNLKIFTTFIEQVIEIHFNDFQSAVTDFYKRIVTDIFENNESIKENKFFKKYLSDA